MLNTKAAVENTDIETNSFHEFDLHPLVQSSLDRMKFKEPTPIQQESIPLVLLGHDILGTAQTGTGKTGAYGIPLISKLIANQQDTALILAPTRELAAQIMTFMKNLLGDKSSIKISLLIGGDSMSKQLFQLRAKPRIIVGTPGRINDHLKRNSLNLSRTSILVLDEADRMLDMGFGIQIDEILKSIPESKQTLMFSATLPNEIVKLAEKYQRDPKRIAIGEANSPVLNIEQEVVRTQDAHMYDELTKRLDDCDKSTIVFVNTKFGADKLATRLRDAGYIAQAIHGDMQQRKREKVIAAFRDGRNKILVATDVAARGLDVPSVSLVVNFGLPQAPEDYIHRIGRTGRAGAKGKAISLVTPSDNRKWRAIEKLIDTGSNSSEEMRGNARGGNRDGGGRSFSKRPHHGQDRFKPRGGGNSRFGRGGNSSFEDSPKRSEGNKVVDIREYKESRFKKSEPRREGGFRERRAEDDSRGRNFGGSKERNFRGGESKDRGFRGGESRGKSFGGSKDRGFKGGESRDRNFGESKDRCFRGGESRGKSFGESKDRGFRGGESRGKSFGGAKKQYNGARGSKPAGSGSARPGGNRAILRKKSS
ncbi:MAG: box helicase [Candidatus Midichloriaceae bacterium]|jgi:superfamily II DNA/RNA helicase|nr:box helicase [Candidatus Midichloriaceae bacterium]